MQSITDNIFLIDAHFKGAEHTAVYLIVDSGRAALVDCGTEKSIPHVLDGMRKAGVAPEQLDFLLCSHIHLDHSAGAGALLAACPNAMVLAHPRAKRHLVDPSRLVAGTRAAWGASQFEALCGAVAPVAPDRIKTLDDGDRVELGSRTLVAHHAYGHARHHIMVHDTASNSLFTGDTFGGGYPVLRPFLIWSCPPVDFHQEHAHETIDKVASLAPERACLSHFGTVEASGMASAQSVLRRWVDAEAAIVDDAACRNDDKKAMEQYCLTRLQETSCEVALELGVNLDSEAWGLLQSELMICSKGLAYCADRQRRRSQQ